MAITMNWAIHLLAANPQVQDWIGEEIKAALPETNKEAWDYLDTYPKLKRVFAVMVSRLLLILLGSTSLILFVTLLSRRGGKIKADTEVFPARNPPPLEPANGHCKMYTLCFPTTSR